MCGIAGFWSGGPDAPRLDEQGLRKVRDRMVDRGPDGAGLWISEDRRVALAHRRLSIIDLSEAGAQPMASADGAVQIVFNGEIYNYRQLRAELEGQGAVFHSQSDTEVLLHLYQREGARFLGRLRGMFAFSIWDSKKRELMLARDPLGIKPLYVSRGAGWLAFASQVKALALYPGVDLTRDFGGEAGFLTWGFVPDPLTLYRGIRAVEAGTYWIVREGGEPRVTEYFSLDRVAERAREAAHNFSPSEALERARAAWTHTTAAHFVSDVPVGVFLSAGLDSVGITTAAVRQNVAQPLAVTLGFREYENRLEDETPIAGDVARSLGLEHRIVWFEREDFQELRERLLDAMDQPTIDGVNTFLISAVAKRAGLKVALSGLGGDEVLGGYASFLHVPILSDAFFLAPLTRPFGRTIRKLTAPIVSRVTSPKLASLFEYSGTPDGAYLLRRGLYMPWELPGVMGDIEAEQVLREIEAARVFSREASRLPRPLDRLSVSLLEMTRYMRSQLLRDSDWAGMAHSVEIRTPLVDVPFLEGVLPYLVQRRFASKSELIREIVPGIPEAVLSRKKTGFMVPTREWVFGDQVRTAERGLRGWARALLGRNRGGI